MAKKNQAIEDIQDQKKRPRAKPATAVVKNEQVSLAGPTEMAGGPISAVGGGPGQADWLNDRQIQGALLDDSRFSQRANAAQRARIVSQLQYTHGNVHVQRVLDRVQSKRPDDSKVIQRSGLEIAALGLAAFAEGRALVTRGQLEHSANCPSFMHEHTPSTETWETMTCELHIAAVHPRLGWGPRHFWFRLSYERNGYDIRNATINLLEDRSSGMIMSTFEIGWVGQAHSQRDDPIALIIFNISGRWDPAGLAVASFWGRLIISASKEAGFYEEWNIESESTFWSPRPVVTAT